MNITELAAFLVGAMVMVPAVYIAFTVGRLSVLPDIEPGPERVEWHIEPKGYIEETQS